MKLTDVYQTYPQGWFAVAFSKELLINQVLTKKIMGKELVLWRSSNGDVHLQSAYCPHLGTHLGHCGKVVGERIQCPFHGFTFSGQGECSTYLKKVNSRDGTPAVSLKTYPVVEQNGVIFSSMDSSPELAQWLINPIDLSDYTQARTAQFKIKSTPHEITENTVDLRHFSALHKYRETKMEYESEGQYLQVKTFIKRDGALFGRSELVEIETITHHFGLGYANVNIKLVDLDLHFIGFVFPTPIDHQHIELRFMLHMKKIVTTKKIHPILRFIPKSWVTNLVFWQSFRGFVMNVAEDLPIWQNKAYLPEPALSNLDGPIPFYRDWADQFYQPIRSKHVHNSSTPFIQEKAVES